MVTAATYLTYLASQATIAHRQYVGQRTGSHISARRLRESLVAGSVLLR